jgi:heme/copper-type cytochrome/quinol oxidase subunit 2
MRVALAGAALLAGLGLIAAATPASTVVLVLKNHRFTPSSLTVPADRKLTLRLVNQDPAGEEFDSRDLGVEEDVTPNGSTSFEIGPLKPGRYSFMGEYHAQTAEGEVIAVPAGAAH